MINEELLKMSDNELVLTAVLPEDINTFEYTRNHHFLRFKRKDGREIKILPQDMVLYFCEDNNCDFEMLTDYNRGLLRCPVCKHSPMQMRWTKKQTCFVPEKESDFEWPDE